MKVDKVVICRLCLKTCQNGFHNINNITREALKFLLLDVNLDVSYEPALCTTCMEGLKKCFDFKSDCMRNINSKRMKLAKTDVSGQRAYLRESREESASSISNFDMCFCCMKMVNLDSSVLLKNEENNTATTLEKYFPELGINIAEDAITCTSCYKSMQILVGFISRCLVVEENIKEYCNIEGTNSEGQIELTAMLNFTFKGQLKSVVAHDINVPKVVEDCSTLKNEGEIEIKSEDYAEVEVEELELSDIKEECSIKIEDEDGRFEDATDQENASELTMLTHKTASEVTMFKCDMCPYQSKLKGTLVKHMLTHRTASEVTMFKCDMCPFQSIRKLGLQAHILTHKTGSEVTMNKCGMCLFQSKYKTCLSRHMLTHRAAFEVTMFKCDMCPFQSKHKESLHTHMLIHKTASEVTMFKCDMCTFQSKYKQSLQVHMLTHKTLRNNDVQV